MLGLGLFLVVLRLCVAFVMLELSYTTLYRKGGWRGDDFVGALLVAWVLYILIPGPIHEGSHLVAARMTGIEVAWFFSRIRLSQSGEAWRHLAVGLAGPLASFGTGVSFFWARRRSAIFELLSYFSLLSVVVNLLPLPAFDGGHILYHLLQIEGAFGLATGYFFLGLALAVAIIVFSLGRFVWRVGSIWRRFRERRR